MKVCRICLSQDGRLYPIKSNGLRALYHQLIGVGKLQADVENMMPQWVCVECGLRLMSYNKLRQKGLRSHQILTKLLDKVTPITKDDINKIDREKNNLQSSLSVWGLNNGTIQQSVLHIQETDETDCKPKLEFINDMEMDDPILGFKTEKDECHSETAVSNIESISDCESYVYFEVEEGSLSSDSESSINQLVKPVSSNTQRKPRIKKAHMNINNKGEKEEVNNDVGSSLIEDVFSVKTLSWEEQMAEFKRRKCSKNYLESPFKCNDCFKGFSTDVTFARHKLTHSDKMGKIECQICKSRFRFKKTYLPHMTAHRTLYSCNKCEFITRQRCVAARHTLTHKGKVYKCPHCYLEFANQSSYLSHVRIKHVSQFVCEYCGYSFVSAKGVGYHKIKKHALQKKKLSVTASSPTCETCNIKFLSDEALCTHRRVSHSKPSDNKSTYNNETYRRKKKLLTCELCGAITADATAYKNHFRRQHPNNTPTKFPSTTPNKPGRQLVCEQCGRVFRTKYNLLKHGLVHTDLRPFECDECNKRFKSKLRVQAHIIKVHLPKKSDVKMYACGICQREFSQNSSRKRHIMSVHLSQRTNASFMATDQRKATSCHFNCRKIN